MKKIYLSVMFMPLLNGCCCGRGVVELPRVHTDSVNRVVYRTDTLYIADSVRIERIADTVYSTRVRNIYRSRSLTDTLHHTVIDTMTIAAAPQRVRQKWWWRVPAWVWVAVAFGATAMFWARRR